MRRQGRVASAWGIIGSFLAIHLPAFALSTTSFAVSGHAADLVWEVENPFRVLNPIRQF